MAYEGGFEIRLLEFAARTMNMSIVYRHPPSELWGEKLENGSWTGIYKELMLDTADIAFAGTILSQNETLDMDFTVSHGPLGFMWVVPCAKPFPRWKSITRVFSLTAWLLIFMTILLAAGILTCLAKCGVHELTLYKTLSGCLFCTWAVVLGVSPSSAPSSVPVRFFFILWMWYSVAINTLFQTFVTSYLVDPGLQKQIQSIGDILRSGVQYGFHPDLNASLQDESNKHLIEIVTHSEPCNFVEACTQRVAKRGDFVTISNHHRVEYLNTYKTLGDNGEALLCTFGDKVILSFKTFYLPQGSPLLYRFNRAISVAVQAGLVEYWWQSELVTSRIKAASIRKISPLDNYSTFLLIYLQPAFYLLLLGHCFAFLTFVGELFLHQISQFKLNHQLRQAVMIQAGYPGETNSV
ncbi:glutamate receptor ionotropic, kainate 4-like [Zootermopsis nevadensis]|uniref:glutamate receptor ionotropic, kainate 4-like n=1 Tax=Zootermopsis nevadensis TaxID=136037 RepID=UPI000B8ED071|nr:glutamate receptor ionotropic, kainate 4-like [Zootermopsis nevadensis]